MPIIGLKFDSFEGKREKDATNQSIKINSSPRITDLKEIKVPNLDKKALAFSFEFLTTYEPDIGTIRVTGEVLFLSDAMPKITADWKKKKTLPAEMSADIINYLLRRCLLKVATMAEDLQLPPPLGFPKLKPKEQEGTDYVG
jgi:hypothetical protein